MARGMGSVRRNLAILAVLGLALQLGLAVQPFLGPLSVRVLEIAKCHAAKMPATFMPVSLVVVFGSIGWHIPAMFRAGGSR